MIPSSIRAYHEAGHAVAAALLGIGVQRLTISPRGKTGGHVGLDPADFRSAPVGDLVMVYLAGFVGASMDPAAQGDDESVIGGAGDDLDRAEALLGDLDGPGRDAYLQARSRELWDRFCQDGPERAVHGIASMLLEREDLVIGADLGAAQLLTALRP